MNCGQTGTSLHSFLYLNANLNKYLLAYFRSRDVTTAEADDQIKLTLAVEAKPDLMYDIDTNKKKNNNNKQQNSSNRQGDISHSEAEAGDSSDDGDDNEPSIGEKRKYNQLGKIFNDNGVESDREPSRNAVKRARIEALEEADEHVKSGGLVDESDDEDVFKPGATIKMGVAAAAGDVAKVDPTRPAGQ